MSELFKTQDWSLRQAATLMRGDRRGDWGLARDEDGIIGHFDKHERRNAMAVRILCEESKEFLRYELMFSPLVRTKLLHYCLRKASTLLLSEIAQHQ